MTGDRGEAVDEPAGPVSVAVLPWERRRTVLWARLVLVVLWSALALTALLLKPREATLDDLPVAVERGEIGIEVLGMQTSWPVLAVFAAGCLATLWLLVNGPQPWRATRWAWFWLAAPPLGLLAFLLLSGPTPGLGITRPATKRLTGGKAFLLALLLSALVPAPWWW